MKKFKLIVTIIKALCLCFLIFTLYQCRGNKESEASVNEDGNLLVSDYIEEYKQIANFSWMSWTDQVVSCVENEWEKEIVRDMLFSVFTQIEATSLKLLDAHKSDVRKLIRLAEKGKDGMDNDKCYQELNDSFKNSNISEKSLEILLNKKVMLENQKQEERLHTVIIDRVDTVIIISPEVFSFVAYDSEIRKDADQKKKERKAAVQKALCSSVCYNYADLLEKMDIVGQITGLRYEK